MGPLEQARAPDQEPMEPHVASRGSRAKDNGPQEQARFPKSIVNEAHLEDPRAP